MSSAEQFRDATEEAEAAARAKQERQQHKAPPGAGKGAANGSSPGSARSGGSQSGQQKGTGQTGQTGQQQASKGFDPSKLCLTPEQWAERDIPPQDRLLGDLFSTTTRCQLSADTGVGKTMIGLAWAFAIRLGVGFLHWQGHRQGRVLYLDGEMPAELVKDRLACAASWFGLGEPIKDGLFVLSREDVEDMPPLDTPEGERWLLDVLDKLKPDHITCDNISALTITSLKEEDGARSLNGLQRLITKQRIGQLWEHHTGLDTSRGYGPKLREWALDTAMVAEAVEAPGADIAFDLKFPKTRRRTPDNRADFEPVRIELRAGRWESVETDKSTPDAGRPSGRNQRQVYDAAIKLLAGTGTVSAPPGHPAGSRAVISVEAVKSEARKLLSCDAHYFSSRFNDALNGLTANGHLQHYDGWIWR